jgi:hypothetical protein
LIPCRNGRPSLSEYNLIHVMESSRTDRTERLEGAELEYL